MSIDTMDKVYELNSEFEGMFEYSVVKGKDDWLKRMSKSVCVICEEPMPDWEPQFCCSGHECGCMGLPVEPPVCSNKCWSRMTFAIINEHGGKSYCGCSDCLIL